MRTYSGSLMLEDVLEGATFNSPLVQRIYTSVVAPHISVVEEDCKTALGTLVDLDFSSIGMTRLSTGQVMSQADVTSILQSGVYRTAVRSMHSCVSSGGVCVKCAKASMPEKAFIAVGDKIQIRDRYTQQETSVILDPTSTTEALSVSEDSISFDYKQIYCSRDTFTATSSGGALFLKGYYELNDSVFIRYSKESTRPLMSWLARTYTGSILGMRPLESYPTALKHSLIREQVSESKLDILEEAVSDLVNVPSAYAGYCDTISDPLEKALFQLILISLYDRTV